MSVVFYNFLLVLVGSGLFDVGCWLLFDERVLFVVVCWLLVVR